MKIMVDDWHFKQVESDLLVADVFLGNGQHGLLEVVPFRNSRSELHPIPEITISCEFPGEKIGEGNCVKRWVTRPPDRACTWSNVELPPSLLHQIHERLGLPASTVLTV